MKPSANQEAIFKFAAANPQRNILIEAVAGSGKTTTIFQLNKILETVNPMAKNLYLVFNKRNQLEAVEKFAGQNIHVFTFNGFGNRLLSEVPKKLKFNQYKNYNLLEQAAEELGVKKYSKFKLLQLIGLLKSHCVMEDYDAMLPVLLEKYDIELKDRDLEVLGYGFNLSIASNLVDFDDQLYYPIKHGVSFPKYTNVYVDECQDLNPIKIEFVKGLMKSGARIIAVGDRGQAIYGFAGADTESIDTLTKVLDPELLPLNVNYRCSKQVIKYAQRIVPRIEAHENAPEGLVYEHKDVDNLTLHIGDFVLCRVNAPLVKQCFKLLKKNVPARVLGKDVGAKLTDTVKKLGKIDFQLLEEYRAKELEAALKKKRNTDDIEDKYDTIRVLFEHHSNVDTMIEWIENVFTDEVDAKRVVVLSSIHKSKGLEAQTVVLLDRHLLPHPKAEAEWQKVQEKNLEYVAITRAKGTLVLC